MKELIYSTQVCMKWTLLYIVEAGEIQESDAFLRAALKRFRICNECGGLHVDNLL